MSRRRSWTVAIVVLLGALAGGGAWIARRHGPGATRVPARITLEDGVVDLASAFDPAAVVEQRADDAVRQGGVRPGTDYTVEGSYRGGIVVPPPTRLRFRTRVPRDAHLRFGVAVERPATAVPGGGVRFSVTVDGRERWARTLDPAVRRRERRWFDEDVDLGVDTERDVEIVLATAVAGSAGRAAGTPAWSHPRVVRRALRDRQPARAATPNLLVLLVDTVRADALGCYGAHPSRTPTLDRLAAGGRVFEQAISQASWTLPAVATYLTGLYPQSHGLVAGPHAGANALATESGADPTFLPDVVPTLASQALAAGITTVGVSATPLVSRDTNLAHGFETFVEFGWSPTVHDWTPAAEVNRTFLRWLSANADRRFFGYLHYMDAHDPYTPPARLRPPPPPGLPPRILAGNGGDAAAGVNRGGKPLLPATEVAYLHALYEAEIAGWDAELGHLLDSLRAADVLDSTVVVVVADHGEEFQEHGKLKHGIHLYDELVHVPLVLAGPGIAPGRVPAQVQGVDLFPTLAAILGLATPPGLPGQNILAAPTSRPAFSETRYGLATDGTPTRLVSVRTPAWKLIVAPELGRSELFDLAADPSEHADRFGTATAGADLAATLARFEAALPAAPRAAGRDPRLEEKLRALGYVD